MRGPNIARFAAIGVIAGLMPYVPGKMWTATRYTYMSLPFFAVLVAVAAGWVHHHAVRLNRYAAHALAAIALVAIGGRYALETSQQTRPFLQDTDRWQLLADDLRQQYPTVPPGTTVYVVDDEGQWTNPYWQPGWMLSVGRALLRQGCRRARGDFGGLRAAFRRVFRAIRPRRIEAGTPGARDAGDGDGRGTEQE